MMVTDTERSTINAYFAVVSTILLFSTIEVVSKTLTGKIDPVLLASLRFGIGGVLLLISGWKGISTLKRSDLFFALILSAAGVSGTFILFHKSLEYLDASAAAVLFSINPIFCTIIASVTSREKIAPAGIVGLILGFTSVYVISFGFSPPDFTNGIGPAMMIGSAFLFSVYIVGSRKLIHRAGKRGSAGLLFTLGALLMLPFTESWEVSLNVENFFALAYLVLGATALAYILYFYGIGKLGVSKATVFFYLKPFFSTALAAYILHERPDAVFYFGLFMASGALILTSAIQKTN